MELREVAGEREARLLQPGQRDARIETGPARNALGPEAPAGGHRKGLGGTSRRVKDEAFRRRLIEAGTADELYAIIREEDDRY